MKLGNIGYIPDFISVNPILHVMLEGIVENQVNDPELPEVRETVERLERTGLSRHAARGVVAQVFTSFFFDVIKNRKPFDQEKYIRRLSLLGRDFSAVGRNQPCPCGSGMTFKRCCAGAVKDYQISPKEVTVLSAGRNDPCPCGSGKKYKKCCLGKQSPMTETDGERQLKAAEQSLIQKLVAYGNSSSMSPYQKDAFREFFAGTENAPKTFWTEEKQFNYVGWFVFDYRLPTGKRVIEMFAGQKINTLNYLEEQLLRSWLPTAPGLYEVQEVERGRGMLLEDIFSRERYFVHDISSSNLVKKWAILLARIIPVGDLWHFASYLISFFPRDKEQLMALAKKEMSKYKKRHPGAGWEEMLLDRGQVFFQYAHNKQINPVLPKLTNFDGDPLELWKAVYKCPDPGRIKGVLDEIPDFDEDDTANRNDEVSYTWLTKATMRRMPYGETTILGRIFLSKDKLTVETNSRQRLARIKKLLREICGDMLTHKADTLVDGDSLVKQAFEKSTEQKVPNYSRGKKTEALKEAVRQWMTDYYRQWLDEPVPALGGKTPRQAVRTKTGREKVLQLLKEIEYGQELAEENGEPAFDVDMLRKELGI